MSNDKLLSLLKKLHALSQRGYEGEKQNATEMLNAFMAKHGFTESDLETDVLIRREFKVLRKYRNMFSQIVSSVVGNREVFIMTYYEKNVTVRRLVDLTDAEYIEVSMKVDFYLKKYEEDLEVFKFAFIHKNDLYQKTENEDTLRSYEELSEEEKKLRYKMSIMASGMDKHNLHKQIANS